MKIDTTDGQNSLPIERTSQYPVTNAHLNNYLANGTVYDEKFFAYFLFLVSKEGELHYKVRKSELCEILKIPNTSRKYQVLRATMEHFAGPHYYIEGNRITEKYYVSKYTYDLSMADPNLIKQLGYKAQSKKRRTSADFVIELNKNFRELLDTTKGPYTKQFLSVILSMTSPYAIRLYKVLSTQKYLLKKTGNKKLRIILSVDELRRHLGLIETSSPEFARRFKRSGKDNNAESLIQGSVIVNERWDNMRDRYLKPAINEINALSDLSVTYKAAKERPFNHIIFTISENESWVEIDAEIMAKAKEVKAIFNSMFGDCKSYDNNTYINVLKAANYDTEAVRIAAQWVRMQTDKGSLTKDIAARVIGFLKNNGYDKGTPLLPDRDADASEAYENAYQGILGKMKKYTLKDAENYKRTRSRINSQE